MFLRTRCCNTICFLSYRNFSTQFYILLHTYMWHWVDICEQRPRSPLRGRVSLMKPLAQGESVLPNDNLINLGHHRCINEYCKNSWLAMFYATLHDRWSEGSIILVHWTRPAATFRFNALVTGCGNCGPRVRFCTKTKEGPQRIVCTRFANVRKRPLCYVTLCLIMLRYITLCYVWGRVTTSCTNKTT